MFVNLRKRLELWREQSVISEDELQRILQFEEHRGDRSWIGFGIASIGVTAFVTGIISIVAANWESISDPGKLLGYFALQLAVGAIFVRFEKVPGIVRESALTIFALLFWAGIGLFGQVFNLSGTWWQAMLFWLCLTLPAAAHSNSRLMCSVWCITVVATACVWSGESWSEKSEVAKCCTVVTVSTLLTAFGIGAQSLSLVRERLRTAAIVWGLGFLLLVVTPIANGLWITFISGESASFANLPDLILPWSAFGIAALISLLRPGVSPASKRATAILFVLTALYLSIPVLIPLEHSVPKVLRQVGGAGGFLAVWVAAATAAALGRQKVLFDLATFVLAVRFIVIYFEVFGTLSTTGFGLIISGLIIIGVAVVWNRGRRTVSKKLLGGV